MRRSIAWISVGVTAFSIVLLASVVYGFRAAADSPPASSSAATGGPAALPSPELAAAAEIASPTITPQSAVTIASIFLSRTDPFSVQLSSYNGQAAYVVTFSSGDVVYVSLSGEVLGSVPAAVEMASSNRGRRESDGGSGGNERQEHEVDHESEHETETQVEAGD